jgi:hypothetical protein
VFENHPKGCITHITFSYTLTGVQAIFNSVHPYTLRSVSIDACGVVANNTHAWEKVTQLSSYVKVVYSIATLATHQAIYMGIGYIQNRGYGTSYTKISIESYSVWRNSSIHTVMTLCLHKRLQDEQIIIAV